MPRVQARIPSRRPDPGVDPPPVAEGTLRVDAITGIPAVLRALGVAPVPFLAEAGLDPGLFDDPANAIPVSTLGRLLRLAAERTGCAHLGLLVGQRSGLASLGLVGRLVQSSPDVGTALRNLVGHLHVRDRGAVASFQVQGGMASLGYAIYQTGVEAGDQICDGAIAIAMNAMRTLCGAGWRPTEVLLSQRRPADPTPFRRVFEAPLRFDVERTALVFPAAWLRHRSNASDPAAYRRLLERVEALEARAERDLVADLRRMLRTLLVGGSGSVESVAERLAIHRRTLNRRLQARGTSLHRLVEEIRFEIARQLVELTRMPLVEISAALGYADASAFTRAFRRWSGRTPSEWREDPRRRRGANCQARAGASGYHAPARDRRASLGRSPWLR
jgi:AraC-like DNA-binding protein